MIMQDDHANTSLDDKAIWMTGQSCCPFFFLNDLQRDECKKMTAVTIHFVFFFAMLKNNLLSFCCLKIGVNGSEQCLDNFSIDGVSIV